MAYVSMNPRTVSDNRFIHFAVFTMVWDVDHWTPRITKLYDTTSLDVIDMLGAKSKKQGESYDLFVKSLRGKLPGAVIK